MKKIFIGLVAVLVGMTSVQAQGADKDKPDSLLNQAVIKQNAEKACNSNMQRLVYDGTAIIPQSPATGSGEKELNQYGFPAVKPGNFLIGYWHEKIDGPLPKNLGSDEIKKAANAKDIRSVFFALNKGKKVISNEFLCPNPNYVSKDAYMDNGTQSVFRKHVCRSNLLTLIKQGCETKLVELLRNNHGKIQAKKTEGSVKKEKEAAYKSLDNFFSKENNQKFDTTVNWDETNTNFSEKKRAALVEAKKKWEVFLDARAKLKTNFEQYTNEKDAENKQKYENFVVIDKIEVSIKNFHEALEQFDEHLSENKTDGTDTIDVSKILNPVLGGKTTTEIYTKETKDSLTKLFENQNKSVNELRKTSNKAEALYKHKIEYINERVSQLAFSQISDGVSSFNVSEVLVSKNDGKNISKEGEWTLFDTGDGRQNFFDKIIKLVTGVAGTLGVVVLIIGVVMLVISNGDDSQVTKAKELIMYALGGLFVIFISFMVIQFVIDLLVW